MFWQGDAGALNGPMGEEDFVEAGCIFSHLACKTSSVACFSVCFAPTGEK